MAQRIKRTHAYRPHFYLVFGAFALLHACLGFYFTFVQPLVLGRLQLPAAYIVHGALFFGWLLLFNIQVWLIRANDRDFHRMFGLCGCALALAMVPTTLYIGALALLRDVATDPISAKAALAAPVMDMALFCVLVILAIRIRHRSATHKRLMVVIVVHLLGASTFRLLRPFIEDGFTLGLVATLINDSILLVAIARDWWHKLHVYSSYLWGGGAMLLTHLAELWVGETALWQALANQVVLFLTN